eukprot:m.356217 g.356217  ORF g.356217 m.356217 type:complete len:68 (+) comp28018_c3_seq1:3725-3928(+)
MGYKQENSASFQEDALVSIAQHYTPLFEMQQLKTLALVTTLERFFPYAYDYTVYCRARSLGDQPGQV